MAPRRPPRFALQPVFLSTVVLVCVSILSYLLLIQSWSLRQTSLAVRAGDVAPQDVRAPRDVRYVSNVLTEAARADAERGVSPVYASPDPAVARTQIEKLTAVLETITSIRQDQVSTVDKKKSELLLLADVNLQPKSTDVILGLTDERWQAVEGEALNVLSRIMQASIRSDGLDAVRQSVPARVSYTMSVNEAGVIADLVTPLVTANSFYSPQLTDAARQAASAAVQPVTQSYVKDQTIISRGQIITDADLEAMTVLGLADTGTPAFTYLGPAALVGLSAVFLALYFYRRRPAFAADLRSLLLLALLFLIFLAAVRVTIPNRTVLPYLFPVPAFGLLVAALFGFERGLIFSLLMSVMAAYGQPDALGLLPYYTLSSLCGILALGQARRVGQFLYSAAAITGAGIAMVVAYRLPFSETDWVGVATLVGAAFLNGIASVGIALPLQYLLAQFVGMTTAMQLLEISRPDYPLLKYFLQRAPGTYQHSLQVANLAEQAAEHIQADGLLTRVGALFHDIGKTANPLFFIENQPPGQIDSHNNIPPEVVAETIINHIPEGVNLARKHRLPRRIHDFIREHHGTLITRYQYNLALKAAGGDASRVDEAKFRYPGPMPRSKETAILMFADGVEATARAENPADDDQMRILVRNVIERCQKDRQLEDAPLSQRDLSAITDSFVTTLRVTYHPRLEYPQDQQEKPAAGTEAPAPAASPAPAKKTR